MKEYEINYYLCNNHVKSDVKEYENIGIAVKSIGDYLKNEIIVIVMNRYHVIEIPTKNIIFHEVIELGN